MPAPEDTLCGAPTVTLWGAAGEVTGSQHLVQAGSGQFLLDCRLVMEKGPEARQRNAHFPFDPYRLDAVLLSHAHLDHSGNLPNLTKQGFAGPLYCTRPTRDLIRWLLPAAARIQEEAALRFNAGRRSGVRWVEPIFSHQDVDN